MNRNNHFIYVKNEKIIQVSGEYVAMKKSGNDIDVQKVHFICYH